MHLFDHLPFESFGSPGRRSDQPLCARNLVRAWRKGKMAWCDLIGMNQALAVEAEGAPFPRLRLEPGGIVKPVEYAIEHRLSLGTSSQDDSLQRR